MSAARPLAGRRILLTRTAEQSADLADALTDLGAEVEIVPLLAFAPPTSWEAADRAIDRIGRYAGILFTSANAVERFCARVHERVGFCDVPAWPDALRAFAVGTKTAAAMRGRGFAVDALPAEQHGTALAATILASLPHGSDLLFPRAQAGRDETAIALAEGGASVDVVPVYRTVLPADAAGALRAARARGDFDAVAFASPSAVAHLVELLGGAASASAALRGVRIAAIGPTTASALEAHGLRAGVVSPDLAAALTTLLV